ncbi:hypothetical protein P20652_3388 [Pseudoalteromonas sp. BSi20652]|nr:hypothetical protein P20652_3388 [Pseudoalteromonas sp. BSi20652]
MVTILNILKNCYCKQKALNKKLFSGEQIKSKKKRSKLR